MEYPTIKQLITCPILITIILQIQQQPEDTKQDHPRITTQGKTIESNYQSKISTPLTNIHNQNTHR